MHNRPCIINNELRTYIPDFDDIHRSRSSRDLDELEIQLMGMIYIGLCLGLLASISQMDWFDDEFESYEI